MSTPSESPWPSTLVEKERRWDRRRPQRGELEIVQRRRLGPASRRAHRPVSTRKSIRRAAPAPCPSAARAAGRRCGHHLGQQLRVSAAVHSPTSGLPAARPSAAAGFQGAHLLQRGASSSVRRRQAPYSTARGPAPPAPAPAAPFPSMSAAGIPALRGRRAGATLRPAVSARGRGMCCSRAVQVVTLLSCVPARTDGPPAPVGTMHVLGPRALQRPGRALDDDGDAMPQVRSTTRLRPGDRIGELLHTTTVRHAM